MDLSKLPLDDLARWCAEETDKFRRKLAVDSRYCYELFRRALEEQIQDAFTYIFRIYQAQCARWARSVVGFEHAGEPSPEPFVSEAFASLFRDLRGERFARFRRLESVLLYLKKCVVTTVLQQLRRSRVLSVSSEDDETLDGGMEEVESEHVWQRICQLLPDENDQLLADCRFRQNIKPAEIVRLHPNRWASAREVSVALQRICRTLRKDRELRVMAGLSPADEQLLDIV